MACTRIKPFSTGVRGAFGFNTGCMVRVRPAANAGVTTSRIAIATAEMEAFIIVNVASAAS